MRDLSEILIRYAATVHGARMNLDNLMGELVDEVNAWNDGVDTSEQHPGNWLSLSGFKVVDAMMEAAAATSNQEQLKENQVYFKLTTFLSTADQLPRVNAIIGDLDRVRDGRNIAGMDIPVWPA